MQIKKAIAREVLDSRGNPTVECDVYTKDWIFSAVVPSGASTGVHESLELRDKQGRYSGKGVLKAVKNVNSISKRISKIKFGSQIELDAFLLELDGTSNKSRLGANAILGVSMAACRAFAADTGMELYEYLAQLSGRKGTILPTPYMNVINSGKHAGIENDIQEHMIVPKGRNFAESLRIGTEVYHTLKKLLKKKYGAQATLLGDEGGFAPKIKSVRDRLALVEKAINQAGYSKKVSFALDCAASEFYHKNGYILRGKKYSPEKLIDLYKDLAKEFKIISIEDGFAEDDWESWTALTKEIGKRVQIVGDDLLVTNVDRIQTAIEAKACNSLLLKVNQIGTVTESIAAAELAFKDKWTVMVSHRSGETEDNFISDLVVGLSTGQSKFGAPARSDRNAKYNQLLRIEEQLGKRARLG